jgi:hypothetical protein
VISELCARAAPVISATGAASKRRRLKERWASRVPEPMDAMAME